MTDLITRQPPETADRPDEPPEPPPRRPRRTERRVAAVAAAVVLVAGAGTAGGFVATEIWDRPAATSTTAAAAVSSTATTLADVVAAVAPSVVTITVSGPGGTVEGSGVIVTNDGRILTNYHVVENARGAVTVDLSDGRSVSARVVRTDPDSDLALLKADGVTGLTAAPLGDSGSLSVGDSVLAFGSPLGLEGSVTAGIVSALDRDADDLGLHGLVQTDAPINSGNSGGPLVDTAGRVVGITVANATTDRDGGSVGLGFAIPIDAAQAILL